MNSSDPSRKRRSLILGAIGVGIGGVASVAAAQAQPRVIKIVAEPFRYTPNRIELKKGETVILEFTSMDVPMGFNAPAFKVRANILPDEPAQVQLKPQVRGTFEFFCDIVCGSGHKDMRGVIVVS